MFEIEKTLEISSSHILNLPYKSKCCNPLGHGHNFSIKIFLRASDEEVDQNYGMVLDFVHIKNQIQEVLDHTFLNEVEGLGYVKIQDKRLPLNPTAENMARWICERTPHCYKVEVQESSGNVARYLDESM